MSVLSKWVAIYDSVLVSVMFGSLKQRTGVYYYKICAVNLLTVQRGYDWYRTFMLCIIV